MKCTDVREMAESYLAGELPLDTTHAIVAHLERCSNCGPELARRQALRETLRRAILTSPELAPDPDFMANLRGRVGDPQTSTRARFSVPSGWLALAASVALIVLAAWQITRMSRVQPEDWLAALVAHAAGNHRYCALEHALEEAPISLEEAARRYGAVYASLRDVVAAASPVRDGEVELLGAHWCVFQDRRFAHLVVRRREHVASILLTPIEGARAAALGEVATYPASGGLQVAGFLVNGHAGFVVSDLSVDENVTLARELAPVLRRYFART